MTIQSVSRHEFGLLLLIAAAAPLGFACSSDAPGGGSSAGAAPVAGAANSGAGSGGAPSAGAPSAGASSAGAAAAGAPSAGAGAGGASAGAAGAGTGGSNIAGAAGATGSGGVGGGSSGGFVVTSPDQMDGAKFGSMFTCAAMNGMFGSGVNPELDWTGVPANTLSFAITFIDTKIGADMAMGQHWAMWDIPAAVKKLPKGTTAISGELAGAKQSNKYLSPCPSGDDTYEFTVYALSTATLSVSGAEGTGTANSAGVAKVLAALKGVTPLGTAKLHGTSGAMGK